MIEWWQIGLLFATGLVAGFVDTLAGGGGLLTLPVLLNFCPDAQFALGTNKLQASFGSSSATFHFARAGVLSARECLRACALAFVGSLAGSLLVQHVDSFRLKQAIPVVLLAVAIFVWWRPQLGEQDIRPRLSRWKFDFTFALGIGLYDGFFGPGTGTFLALAFMLGLGFNLAKSTAHAKALNCASNLASLLVFLLAGKVKFAAGVAMGCGQSLGARLASRLVLTRGTKFIRPIFLTMVMLISLKLIWDMWLAPLEIRNPKPEIQKKSEIRSLEIQSGGVEDLRRPQRPASSEAPERRPAREFQIVNRHYDFHLPSQRLHPLSFDRAVPKNHHRGRRLARRVHWTGRQTAEARAGSGRFRPPRGEPEGV